MATSEQIDAAVAEGRKRGGPSGRFTEPKAEHILHGATVYEQAEARRAARLLTRATRGASGDADRALGLDEVRQQPPAGIAEILGAELLDELLDHLHHGRTDAAADAVRAMGRLEAEAVRTALRARREDR